ncbi:uncharacterized protein LOC143825436 [Paroedura picta]|uniref:uncharacterized protein LOC143825436 n=1 Tax=Paroedura picta TaxID=143630 RepID=UPI004056FC0C
MPGAPEGRGARVPVPRRGRRTKPRARRSCLPASQLPRAGGPPRSRSPCIARAPASPARASPAKRLLRLNPSASQPPARPRLPSAPPLAKGGACCGRRALLEPAPRAASPGSCPGRGLARWPPPQAPRPAHSPGRPTATPGKPVEWKESRECQRACMAESRGGQLRIDAAMEFLGQESSTRLS